MNNLLFSSLARVAFSAVPTSVCVRSLAVAPQLIRSFSSNVAAAKPQSKTIIVKIGSNSLFTANAEFMNMQLMCSLVETLSKLRASGNKVVLVTSGAVAVGCQRLGIAKPKKTSAKQAIAAIGQGRLMSLYDDIFSMYKQPIAQILLTRDCIGHQKRATYTMNTLNELFKLGAIPVINENDTVAVDELKVGDNDTLAALTASLVKADHLVLLTDVDALYTDNPHKNPNAKPIRLVKSLENMDCNISDGAGKWGTGGMETKITAARIASAVGCETVICKSTEPENIIKICVDGATDIGTRFQLPKPAASQQDKSVFSSNKLINDAAKAVLSARVAA